MYSLENRIFGICVTLSTCTSSQIRNATSLAGVPISWSNLRLNHFSSPCHMTINHHCPSIGRGVSGGYSPCRFAPPPILRTQLEGGANCLWLCTWQNLAPSCYLQTRHSLDYCLHFHPRVLSPTSIHPLRVCTYSIRYCSSPL